MLILVREAGWRHDTAHDVTRGKIDIGRETIDSGNELNQTVLTLTKLTLLVFADVLPKSGTDCHVRENELRHDRRVNVCRIK